MLLLWLALDAWVSVCSRGVACLADVVDERPVPSVSSAKSSPLPSCTSASVYFACVPSIPERSPSRVGGSGAGCFCSKVICGGENTHWYSTVDSLQLATESAPV